jgi:CRP/FNR family nitrogen fixation transcriptional regulator
LIERASLRVLPGKQVDQGLEGLEPFGSTVTIQREEELYQPGDAADCCWRIITGCVRKVELLDDGRRHVSAFLLPGDFFGFDDPDTRAFSAEAVTTTTLRCYPRSAVETLAESDAAISVHLAALTIVNLHTAYQRMMLLGRKTSVERLASFILEMVQRLGSVDTSLIDLPMSRADIADYLGLTTETVCRILTEMARSGVIKLTRTGVQILDRPELASRKKAKQIRSQIWRSREARVALAA